MNLVNTFNDVLQCQTCVGCVGAQGKLYVEQDFSNVMDVKPYVRLGC